MIIKQKKNCKIIFNNKNYYVETSNHSLKFKNIESAQYFYENYNNELFELYKSFDVEGKVLLDIYPEDLELILKGIEQLKYFLDKSLYFSDNKNNLKSKSFDCYYLYQYIYSVYKNQVPKEKQKI